MPNRQTGVAPWEYPKRRIGEEDVEPIEELTEEDLPVSSKNSKQGSPLETVLDTGSNGPSSSGLRNINKWVDRTAQFTHNQTIANLNNSKSDNQSNEPATSSARGNGKNNGARGRPTKKAAKKTKASKKVAETTETDYFLVAKIEDIKDWKRDYEKDTATHFWWMPTEHSISKEEMKAITNNSDVEAKLKTNKNYNDMFFVRNGYVICGKDEYDVSSFQILDTQNPKIRIYWPPQEKDEEEIHLKRKAEEIDNGVDEKLKKFKEESQKEMEAHEKKLKESLFKEVETLKTEMFTREEIIKNEYEEAFHVVKKEMEDRLKSVTKKMEEEFQRKFEILQKTSNECANGVEKNKKTLEKIKKAFE